ncbi:MAG TPA: TadE family protein [Urbifossiella sp.]
MLRRPKSLRTNRRGAAAVEAALVMGIFLMLLFGVYEYCRFLMVLHVTNNAARDASRYATVNVGCDPTQVATMKTNILNYATTRMGGVNQNLNGYQVAVYPCTTAGFALSPPQAIPKSLSTTTAADPFNASDPNNPPWNQAAFTERIAVTIRGNYQPVTPLLLLLPSSIPVSITAVMGSEG